MVYLIRFCSKSCTERRKIFRYNVSSSYLYFGASPLCYTHVFACTYVLMYTTNLNIK